MLSQKWLIIVCKLADIDNFPSSTTWEQMKDMFRKVNQADKHYDPQILNVSVDISEHGEYSKSS